MEAFFYEKNAHHLRGGAARRDVSFCFFRLRPDPAYSLEGREPYPDYVVNERESRTWADQAQFDGSTTFSLYLEYFTYPVTFDNGDGTKTTEKVRPGFYISLPEVKRPGWIFKGWRDAEGHIADALNPPKCTGETTYTAVWEKLAPTLTFDSNEVKISDVLSRMNLTGYTFLPSSSAWKEDDLVTLADDGSTSITLRFSAN